MIVENSAPVERWVFSFEVFWCMMKEKGGKNNEVWMV